MTACIHIVRDNNESIKTVFAQQLKTMELKLIYRAEKSITIKLRSKYFSLFMVTLGKTFMN